MTEGVWRNELKYICTQQELSRIEQNIRHICSLDTHADAEGEYLIQSLYFDDYCDTCLWENENGVDPREKFRIRMYNGSTDRISLECKKKAKGMTRKEACLITAEECKKLMRGEMPEQLGNRALLERFVFGMSCRMFRPKVIVQYERKAFVYPLGNVRITFDRNISCSMRVADFMQPDFPVRPVMPTGLHILEVKYDGFLPDYIYNALQAADLKQTAYSKYYVSRRQVL